MSLTLQRYDSKNANSLQMSYNLLYFCEKKFFWVFQKSSRAHICAYTCVYACEKFSNRGHRGHRGHVICAPAYLINGHRSIRNALAQVILRSSHKLSVREIKRAFLSFLLLFFTGGAGGVFFSLFSFLLCPWCPCFHDLMVFFFGCFMLFPYICRENYKNKGLILI